jgi:hypothetical protein
MSEIARGIHRIEEDLGPRFMAQYVLVGDERRELHGTRLADARRRDRFVQPAPGRHPDP